MEYFKAQYAKYTSSNTWKVWVGNARVKTINESNGKVKDIQSAKGVAAMGELQVKQRLALWFINEWENQLSLSSDTIAKVKKSDAYNEKLYAFQLKDPKSLALWYKVWHIMEAINDNSNAVKVELITMQCQAEVC